MGRGERVCKRPRMERTAAKSRLREMTVCTRKLRAAMAANTRPAWDQASQCSNGGGGGGDSQVKEGGRCDICHNRDRPGWCVLSETSQPGTHCQSPLICDTWKGQIHRRK